MFRRLFRSLFLLLSINSFFCRFGHQFNNEVMCALTTNAGTDDDNNNVVAPPTWSLANLHVKFYSNRASVHKILDFTDNYDTSIRANNGNANAGLNGNRAVRDVFQDMALYPSSEQPHWERVIEKIQKELRRVYGIKDFFGESIWGQAHWTFNMFMMRAVLEFMKKVYNHEDDLHAALMHGTHACIKCLAAKNTHNITAVDNWFANAHNTHIDALVQASYNSFLSHLPGVFTVQVVPQDSEGGSGAHHHSYPLGVQQQQQQGDGKDNRD